MKLEVTKNFRVSNNMNDELQKYCEAKEEKEADVMRRSLREFLDKNKN